MPSFLDIASSLTLPSCCMRKNPTPKQQVQDDLTMIAIAFGLYLFSYWWGFHSLCILSVITMNLITFQAGFSFNEYYPKTIHMNHFDDLDVSTSSDNSDTSDEIIDELSLKQREQGATSSRGMTEEQEDKLYEQLQQVVEEVRFRNRKRSALNTGHTPSSTSLVNDEYPPIALSDVEDDYDDMPDLVPVDEQNPVIQPIYDLNTTWADVPNFSQTHYLHNYIDEID